MRTLLLGNLAVTCVLVGLIWTIQLVHYPLFARVGEEEWAGYHGAHTARITLLVGPLMLGELVLAGLLALAAPPERRLVALAAAGCVAVAWLATAFVSVPIHGRLSGTPDPVQIAALVKTNWIRTVAWTARALALFGWAARE